MYLSPGLLMGCPRISSDLGFPFSREVRDEDAEHEAGCDLQGKAILIGITDFGGFTQEYTGTFVDILRVQFDDIDHEMDPDVEELPLEEGEKA